MKTKFLFILLALFSVSPVMRSQKSVDQLFNEFSKEKGVEHVAIGSFTMKLAGLFTDVMGVTGVDVLSFDDCEQPVKDRLNQAIASLKDENFETMISVNEDGDHTKILVKVKDETIREMIVLTTGDSFSLIRIKGKIKPSDVETIIDKNKPGKE